MDRLCTASARRRRTSSVVMFLYFVVVVVADSIRHHSASASDAAGLGEKFSSEHLDKDENDLIAAAKALTEKSANATTASKKRDHAVAVRAAATPSRTDRVRLMPWSSGDGDDNGHLLSLMLDVTQRVAALQDAVADMRHENKLNYRQLKRHMLRLSASRQINVAIPPINAKSGPRPVLQSAFHVDRPQADQHEQPHHQHQQETLKIAVSSTKPTKQQQEQGAASQRPRARCAEGFEYSGELDSCYRLSEERTTWRMARQRCRQLNADLAVVDSSRQQRYVNMKARSNPDTRHCDFWIGLVRGRGGVDGSTSSSSSSSSWHWVGDIGNARTPSYTNWNINEPNNANSYEHCTQMLWIFSWRWNDAHCNYGNACYICQTKAAPQQ